MGRIFQPLLFLFARCTRNQLIRQIEFLKAENEMLRKRVPRKYIFLKADERAHLLKLGRAIGPALQHLITIVKYDTFLLWGRKEKGNHQPRTIGRPRTEESIRNLIVKIASETGWGYTRVMGELKKLRIKPPSRTTVKNILKAHKLEPGPQRGEGSWDDFLKRHAETLWQCDFFSRLIWTKSGLRQCYVLVFLHLGSRQVFLTKCTQKPNAAWIKSQADGFVTHVKSCGLKADRLIHDHDVIYSKEFNETLRASGIRVKLTSFRSPNLQAHVERFIQSLQQEALDHYIVFGERHFDYLVEQYVEHYHTERPHQARGNAPLTGDWLEPDGDPPDATSIESRSRLGGVLKHYKRVAA